MTINIEYETDKELKLDYEDIINRVINEAVDYAKCPYEAEVNVTLTDNDEIKKIIKDNNYLLFNASKCSIKEIVDEASYFGLGIDKKWLVVTNADFFGTGKISDTDNELLSKYLEHANEATNIIFTT
mgnify:FL=1